MTRARCLFSLVAGGCATLMLSPQAGNAQSDAETLADLRACASLERERARLACFDGVLASEREAQNRTAPNAAPPAPGRSGSNAAPLAPARAPSNPAAPAPESAASNGAARAVRSDPDATPAPVSPQRAAADTDRAGRASDQDEMPRSVTVVNINDNIRGAARFVTESGQVLIQTGGGTPRGGYPEVPFDAALEDGALGSLFLVLAERRRVRVRWAD